MATNYVKHLETAKAQKKANKTLPVHGREGDTPQTQTLDETQVQNSAGGFSFEASALTKLDRWLILGSEGGTYYNSEKKLTVDSAKNIVNLIETNGVDVINRITEISFAGRAIKNDPAIFALALCAASGKQEVSKAAFAALPRVARTGTHLFTFAEYVNSLRGWGKALRAGIANWYDSKPLDKLAYTALKYQQRNGWSHRDLFRLAHIKTEDVARNALYRYIVRRERVEGVALPGIIDAFEKVQTNKTVSAALAGIREYNMSFEMLPTELLKEKIIWEEMLPNMGITAMIRNLGKMSSIGLLGSLSDTAKVVIERLGNVEELQKARVHPVALLCALKVYDSGHGMKGSLTWNVNTRIKEALNEAFYASFGFIEPTGKTFLQAVDCSGSMYGNQVNGAPGICAAMGAAVLAMVTTRIEKNSLVVGYGHSKVGELKISPTMPLETVMKVMEKFSWGGTDCALPIKYADENKLKVDVYSNFTDSEVWAGPTHPSKALERYREKYNINSKMIVVGMCVNGFTIADPKDPLQMDMVGFDTATPLAIAEFAKL